jgi:hypothetical protein
VQVRILRVHAMPVHPAVQTVQFGSKRRRWHGDDWAMRVA